MTNYVISPVVNSTQEFIEIANDFSNPLDLVREAISNAFDAGAKNITLGFSVVSEDGEDILKIEIEDDGSGMDKVGLQSFFDLGNSLRRATKKVTGAIGEKGHGTKVYFNSKKIEVITQNGVHKFHAVMDEPKKNLFSNTIPQVNVSEETVQNISQGTKVIIWGYNGNRRDKFAHDQVKDYILWFTKFGSVEQCFDIKVNAGVKLKLKGVDKNTYECINFGHVFPKENHNLSNLFRDHMVQAPKYYCKKIVKTKVLTNYPEIVFQAVFYIEGNMVKYGYNRMLRHPGYSAPAGAYTVQDRYGLWLCKDYVPVQRKNEWIISKGSEYTKFHAFVNCQGLRLTANRGSIENTPSEILQDLKVAVEEIYEDILGSKDWADMDWLESEADAYNTAEREKNEFNRRIKKANAANIADYSDPETGKTIHLIEPQQENGVFTIFMQLSNLKPDIFPFTIVDYDTHFGIDVIAKENSQISIKNSTLYYVEFKNILTKDFNHTFSHLYSIVCWDINHSRSNPNDTLSHGMEIEDIAGKKRKLKIVKPEGDGDYTRYYLDDERDGRKIEIFVLKYYLKEKFGIVFSPRTEDSIL